MVGLQLFLCMPDVLSSEDKETDKTRYGSLTLDLEPLQSVKLMVDMINTHFKEIVLISKKRVYINLPVVY